MGDERWNEIFVGGVRLTDVQSGDVSAVEATLRHTIASGGGWAEIAVSPEVSYTMHVSSSTDVVVRYRG
ncbi:hypothetical protein MT349_19640 [Rathayibacter caricis]|uniref:hypothetical protein n=1 Tax=Rathayibacter caricis TaxID=110936 RepID=UPI001FB4C775|nr:hypothetical protein [Rathayibacter caricis]MCJ1698002.1 hypothetical protein [Rathayibacter caricis]